MILPLLLLAAALLVSNAVIFYRLYKQQRFILAIVYRIMEHEAAVTSKITVPVNKKNTPLN